MVRMAVSLRSSAALTIFASAVAVLTSVTGIPVTVDLQPSDRLHIVQGVPHYHTNPMVTASPPSDDRDRSQGPSQDYPQPRGFAYPQPRVEVARDNDDRPADERGSWKHLPLDSKENNQEPRTVWPQRTMAVPRPVEPPRRYQEVLDNGVRRQPPPVPAAQQHHHHDHEESGSHICVNGKCYPIQPQAYEGGADPEIHGERTPAKSPPRPSDRSTHPESRGHSDGIRKRSTEELNDVRQRYNGQEQQRRYPPPSPQPSGHRGSHSQQGQQGPAYGQSLNKQGPTMVPRPQQAPSSQKSQVRGESVRMYAQRPQQRTREEKSEAKASPLAKAVIDFEKILDMAEEFSYVYPIVRNSYDDVNNILVIELDVSELPNTPEATVETEDE